MQRRACSVDHVGVSVAKELGSLGREDSNDRDDRCEPCKWKGCRVLGVIASLNLAWLQHAVSSPSSHSSYHIMSELSYHVLVMPPHFGFGSIHYLNHVDMSPAEFLISLLIRHAVIIATHYIIVSPMRLRDL